MALPAFYAHAHMATPVIFCGLGGQLYPLCDPAADPVRHSPQGVKALLPVANVPQVAHVLQLVVRIGFTSALVLAPKAQHDAITRALQQLLLCPPDSYQPSVPIRCRVDPGLPPQTALAAGRYQPPTASWDPTLEEDGPASPDDERAFAVHLLALGPDDKSRRRNEEVGSTRPPGTAQLLTWLDSLGKLPSDPLVLPCDLIAPLFPLDSLLQAHLRTDKPSSSPSVSALLYAPQQADGLSKEREKDNPPRGLYAYPSRELAKTPLPLAFQDGAAGGVHELLLAKDSTVLEEDEVRLTMGLVEGPGQDRVRVSNALLDAHAYVLSRKTVLPLLERRAMLTSLREHVLPNLARAGWQRPLAAQLGMLALDDEPDSDAEAGETDSAQDYAPEHATLAAALIARPPPAAAAVEDKEEQDKVLPGSFVLRGNTLPTYIEANRFILRTLGKAQIPLPGWVEDAGKPSPAQARVDRTMVSPDSLVSPRAVLGEKILVKRTVIGAGAVVGKHARLTGCVVADGAVVGAGARLEGCVVGINAKVGDRCTLKDCDVGPAAELEPETHGKNEKYSKNDD